MALLDRLKASCSSCKDKEAWDCENNARTRHENIKTILKVFIKIRQWVVCRFIVVFKLVPAGFKRGYAHKWAGYPIVTSRITAKKSIPRYTMEALKFFHAISFEVSFISWTFLNRKNAPTNTAVIV